MAQPPDADIIIVGGGLSGLMVAQRLQQHGLRIRVLEAGRSLGKKPPDDLPGFQAATAPLLNISEDIWRYEFAGLQYHWDRVRALGGRSLKWGGWCQRIEDLNFRDAEDFGVPWPIKPEELEPHYRLAERKLQVRTGRLNSFFKPIAQDLGLEVVAKRAATVTSKSRAFTGLDFTDHVAVQTQAVVRRLIVGDGRIDQVEIVHLKTGKTEIVKARVVVLCASPIETARLLLASGIDGNGHVGMGLVDHLVATCIAVLPYPTRIELPRGPLQHCALIPRFVNRDRQSRRNYRGGFCVEAVGPMPLMHLGTEAIAGMGIDESQSKQLSCVVVNAIGELQPFSESRVTIDPRRCDSLGRPIPIVKVAFNEDAPKMAIDMDEAVAAIANSLAPPNSRIIRLRETMQAGGISHEAGTARMAKSSRHGVVDAHGAVFDVRGLCVADASIMPTALDRHPTLTLLALALSTTDHIARDCRYGF